MPTVHNFVIWDHFAGRNVRSAYKCTLERIKQIGGETIPDTAEEIEESDLGGDGVYIPPRAHGVFIPPATLRARTPRL
jgi:hypothetical protein